MIEAKVEGHKVVETPEPHIAPGDRHHGSAEEEPRSPQTPKTATAAAGSSSEEESADAVAEQPKRKRAPRKVKTA